MPASLTVGIFVFEGAEELDWVGPWEVFAAWADQWPDDGVEVFTFSREPEVVRCAKGLRILADRRGLELPGDSPAMDVLVIPGGLGVRALRKDPNIATWLGNLAERGTLLASVCTGSLVLAEAGLLDGRPATTHHAYLELLASLGQHVEVRSEARFVDDGPIATAAGVSAGIDLALHLVARLHSKTRAVAVRRYIQYDPDPPV